MGGSCLRWDTLFSMHTSAHAVECFLASYIAFIMVLLVGVFFTYWRFQVSMQSAGNSKLCVFLK